MISSQSLPGDDLSQALGAREFRLQQLEQQLIRQREEWEASAREWRELQRYKQELADWLFDSATDGREDLVKTRIDAALGGEAFIPCSFSLDRNGRKYYFSLVSTIYEIEEL